MLVSVTELPLQASPNSFFAFILCNLIVLGIFLSWRSTSSDSETLDAFPVLPRYGNAERWSLEEEEEPTSVRVTEACVGEIGREEDSRHNSWCECKHEGETAEAKNEEGNRDCDEFRRRIEDFITKVNRERREENQRDGSLRLRQITQEARDDV